MVCLTGPTDTRGADSRSAKRVLIVSTGSTFAPGFTLAAQTAADTLRQLESGPLELYSESLDIVRFPSDSYSRLFRNYLGEKYVDYPPDLVLLIYVGNLALAEKLLEELFPGVPVVVAGLTEEEISPAQPGTHLTGLAQRSDPRGTIELVLRLQPETRRIVVIGGTAEVDTQVTSRAQEAARSLTRRIDFDFWTNRPMSEMTQAVRSLPPQTAILFTRMFRDGAGQPFNSTQAVKLIAESANVPVYIMTSTLLGSGAVGGSVVDVAALARRAGELAHRVLSDATPKSLPLEIRTDGVPTFDWQALQRWGISEARLPPGSMIRNRPRSVWARYQWYIVGAVFIIALQAAMIVELLVQRARRRRVEAKLRENHQFMELATKAGKLGLWMRDLEKDEVWANAHLRSLFEFGPTDTIRFDDVLARIHPYDRGRLALAVERAEDSGLPFEAEFRTILPDGSQRWVVTRGETLNEPRATRRLGAVIDITDRKRAEESLRESENRFHTMANTAPVMIWMSGEDKLCNFFNKGWLDFTGRTLDQELGNAWAEGVHREDLDHCLEVYVNSFDTRQEFTVEYRLRRLDGEYRWLVDTGVPRFAPDGKFLGYIGCATDITERKRTELEVVQQRAELAHIARVSTMGELAASLAHELNQPLTAILSNAQAAQRFLAANPADIEEVREILADIVQDNSRAGDVIYRMRALVKKETLQFASLDLSNVVGDVAFLLRSDAILHNIRVVLEINPDLAPVHGDRVQLQQVLLNLLLNAFDAMKDCPVDKRKITVRVEQDDARLLSVAVRDKGVGVSEDRLDKIFQPFYTTKRDGLGMGLSISRSIIEAHGGHLWVRNNADRGATFYFTLPPSLVSHRSLTAAEP
jgi:PAS domain S-box-containing protein